MEKSRVKTNAVIFLLWLLCQGLVFAGTSPAAVREFHVRSGLGNFFGKLEQGGLMKIAYLGGSITAQDGWRVESLKWFAEQYPQAEIVEINAAIGGTGSDLGVFRLGRDVLEHKPDLLFVEFAVNDGGTPPERIYRSMEGIVRKTLRADPETDICFVYTLTEGMLPDLQAGRYPRAAEAMERLADHYGIPSIHMGLDVARLTVEGKVIFKGPKPESQDEKAALGDKVLFSGDGVHPYTDTGHELYLQSIIRSMAEIKKAGQKGQHKLPRPFVADNWENAQMISLDKARLSSGWQRLDPKNDPIARRFSNRLRDMFKANKPGETVSFRFKGTGVEIYDILGPDCGQVVVRIDDRPEVVVPRFDAYCTYHRLAKLTIAHDLEYKVHDVQLEIHTDQPDKAAILSKRNEKIDDPKRFDGRAWYAGAILVLGEMVEDSADSEKTISQRISDRDFPSIFQAWSPCDNLPAEGKLVTAARHDLMWQGIGWYGLRWKSPGGGLADEIDVYSVNNALSKRKKLLELNPNMIFLAEIRYRDAHRSFLPPGHEWWLRDEKGEIVKGWEEGNFLCLDFHNPQYRQHVANRAKAVVDTGVVDGIMIDWWRDDKSRLELIKLLRDAVGQDRLIIANANDVKTPQTASYINGYFMECYRSNSSSDWARIAETLSWAQANLREPRINCLETWFHKSRNDINLMRATTALSLTLSDGYCLFSDPNPLPTPDHLHNWYSFWDASLGKPLSRGYVREDMSIVRRFESGTVVYNPPGNKAVTVDLESPHKSQASGILSSSHMVDSMDGDIFIKQ